jgi:glycine/D-amino acid oxidase-like deaminating enzyme
VSRAERVDTIVIGAGIVGAACARELARAGQRVLVLDGSFAGSGTKEAGMGHLVVMDDSPAQLALTALSVELWHELASSLAATVELDRCGTIWVAEDGAQMDAVRQKQGLYAQHGIANTMLDATALARHEPQLRQGLAGGLRVPDDAVVYPPGAALWLLADARAHGAVVREHTRVDEILPRAVRCGAEVIEASAVINAAGAAAAQLTPGLPILPRKGHLAITDRAPGFCHHQLVELGYLTSAHTMSSESVAFNIQPRATGQLLIGSSRELVGWDPTTNRALLRRMLQRAVTFMPRLADLTIIRTWTGFRPATPDKLPLIGAWNAVPGLWLAGGHEGLGITTSLGTARLLADAILGRRSAIDATPFSPSRLGTLAPSAI